MKFNPLIIIFFLFWCRNISGQNLLVTKVQADFSSDGKVTIKYRVLNIVEGDSVILNIYGKNRKEIVPVTLQGDIGKINHKLYDGEIIWDVLKDQPLLDEDLQFVIVIYRHPPPVTDIIKPQQIGGGTSNTLISMIAPGVGNIFVQPNKKVGLRPFVTVAFYGLLINGIIMKTRSDKEYDKYLGSQKASIGNPYYENANQYHHQYLVSTRLAAGIWAIDVLCTFLKGTKNLKRKEEQKRNHFTINSQMNIPTLKFNYSF